MIHIKSQLGKIVLLLFLLFSFSNASVYAQKDEWLHLKPEIKKHNKKKIVLISGDEEYRSEETMPMLANILSKSHGFETVVLFAINPTNKQVDPDYQKNIPGLHHLQDADLMIIATRFRELPDEQMKYINDYLLSGKPLIGLRTSTHGFNFKKESKSQYKHYSYNESQSPWQGGFGKLVLGETWINHHGDHGKEGTRAIINGLEAKDNPVLTGVKDIWCPSDVYGIRNKLEGATILLHGQPTVGMTADSPLNTAKSSMPIAWLQNYKLPKGKSGKAFTTTMGASVDFLSRDLRRLIINASYYLLGDESKIVEKYNVDPIKTYSPTMFGFGTFQKGLKPIDFLGK